MDETGPYEATDASKLVDEVFSGKVSLAEALAKLRTRLLDLTMRNRLLNYRAPKGRSFQFTGGFDFDLIYDRLEEGKTVSLAHVPDPPPAQYENGKKPDVRTVAKDVGIATSVDLPRSNDAPRAQRGGALQVLLYPADLERMARKVSSEARTVIEETGTNMLYLVFGFLEYFDSDDSEKAVLAPLLSMPVTLTRGNLDSESRTYLYDVAHSGEDIVENFTLREKLKQQFRLELPVLEEDDTPNVYLDKISKAVSKRRNWTIKRRLTLGFLSFGKLAIWADLDPEKSTALLSSELLRNIFEGGRVDPTSDGFHAEDYDIDKHVDGELPLIYDADSSQHSALIDVKNGKSLVINGPPGTGKSQTITNIVASAIASGKKVLFVSEKLAALEVVKHRLESVGLGDFCLELHSHKTQKKQLLTSIEERMSRQYATPQGYSKRVDVLRERRDVLNAYATLLGSRIGNNLDYTVHKVFWVTEQCRHALSDSVDAVVGITIPGAKEWSAERMEKCRRAVREVAAALSDLGCLPSESPWLGYLPELLIQGDDLPILDLARRALEHAERLVGQTSRMEQFLPSEEWTIAALKKAGGALASLRRAPDELDGALLALMFPGGVESRSRARQEMGHLSAMLTRAAALRREAEAGLRECRVDDEERSIALIRQTESLLSDAGLSLAPGDIEGRASALEAALRRLESVLDGRDVTLPADHDETERVVRDLLVHSELKSLTTTPASRLVELGSAGQAAVTAVKASLDQVEVVLREGNVPFNGRVEELEVLLDGRGMPELLPDLNVDARTLESLRALELGGWGEWTAERFTAKAREIAELLATAKATVEDLTGLMKRAGIPFEATRGSIDDLEVLLHVAESAPQELLPHRTAAFERSDFSDVAIRAEEAHKSAVHRTTKIAAAFHIDALPDDGELREHLQVFRRGDSVFNVFKADWRRASAAFAGCTKDARKLPAREKAERFAAVRTWRTAEREYCEHPEFKSALGGLFSGLSTDFVRVRRLHAWFSTSGPKLLETVYAEHVTLHSAAEQHLALLAGNGARLRAWAASLQGVFKFLANVPGLDPALSSARRLDELAGPLTDYARGLTSNAAMLKGLVRPTASVSRALELLGLRRRLVQHEDLLRGLLSAPESLAMVAGPMGLPASTLSYQNLRSGVAAIEARASAMKAFGTSIAESVGPTESAQSASAALQAIRSVDGCASGLLLSSGGLGQRTASAMLATRSRQASDMRAVAEFFGSVTKPGTTVRGGIASMQAALEHRRQLGTIAGDSMLKSLLGPYLAGEATDVAALERSLAWADIVHEVVAHLPRNTTQHLLRAEALPLARSVAQCIEEANHSIAAYEAAMQKFAERGQLDWAVWGGAPKAADARVRLQRACDGARALVPWSKFLAAKVDVEALGAVELVHCVERGSLRTESLVTAFDYVFHRALSKGILSMHRELARFSGASHEQLRADFAELDREVIKLNGAMYAAKVDAAKRPLPGVSAGRAGDLTELALLHKEVKKQKRHIPIRQLLKRAGRTLLELKPCFMMGPLSVAQYLEQGYLGFDLIVMDEASQLRPEDALGAIARGKQLVVVGDPKQLPPTNFFDQLMADDDEDPDEAPAVVDGAESILGICEHLYRPVRTLRWHYRSKHESLIAFSNSQFYGGRLVVFPSPYRRNRRLGVNYRYVREGSYQDRRNIPEAKRIVDEVIEHMLTCQDESLGVVTLNQTQRELIKDLFDQRSRSLPALAKYLERHEEAGWPFFVKNLENVQGDERDVIFISTTFGRPPDGSPVRQNFGPINRPDGWRRLNVLFTRARRRLDLFTSMLPSDVQVDGDKVSLGRKALRDYLEYARTGTLPGPTPQVSGREPDSDFEIAVADALRLRGYECEPQVGVAGYFIDLGVRHPERKTEFLAGIECDGATYHSSLSARDRDRIRQEILESLGWRGRMIRVWSTDWFSDPKGQTDRLVRHLERRLVEDREQPAPYVDADLDEHEAAPPTPETPVRVEAPTAQVAAEVQAPPPPSDLFVEVGDRVTYETLGAPSERHTVQLVDSPSNLRLGLLNDATPLAQTLLGLCEGDEAVLKVPGKPGAALRVVKIAREVETANLR